MVGSNYRLPAHLKQRLGERTVPCVKCGKPSLPNLTWCRDCQYEDLRRRDVEAKHRWRDATRRAENPEPALATRAAAPTRNAPLTFEGVLRQLLPIRAQRAQYERRLAYHARKGLTITLVSFTQRYPISDDETLTSVFDADDRLQRVNARGIRRWAIKDRAALLAGTHKEGAS